MKLFALTSLLAAVAVVAAAPSVPGSESSMKRSDAADVEARCMGSGCSNQGCLCSVQSSSVLSNKPSATPTFVPMFAA
ncbi:unnamed protein product [Peniophora sp. CBMAI 1063]|nr:unnamed protein product [Peniophora sp. CBMAI 1063]